MRLLNLQKQQQGKGEVFEITKTLSGSKKTSVNAVTDKDGNLLTEETAKRERWKEHFEEILNRPVPDNCITDDDMEPDPVIDDTSTSYITKAEIIRSAKRKLKNRKAVV